MSFLFKSKKGPGAASPGIQPPTSRKLASRDGLPNGAEAGMKYGSTERAKLLEEEDEDQARSRVRQQFSGAAPAQVAPSPAPDGRNYGPRGPGNELAMKQAPRAPQRPPADAALYPWSTQRFAFLNSMEGNPFPRYGASVNGSASKDGDIYMMGGLIDGNTVKGDLWIVEAGTTPMNCYQVPTTSEGPGPRVGHRSLLVGNAFIVFGGDTKMHENDTLDDTLYLLNTSSKHWSRAAPAGPRPAGRYGHTLNILGSKIYVFGGQVEGYFFNDLVAFDLNSLQSSNASWEVLVQNSADGGPPPGQIPPARTNHTVISHDDKLYLFGGTDGVNWFNDVWAYDPRTNAWSQQDCIGFIPAAREGHNAVLVNDVMYVFGGRTDEGRDLGDVAGLRIPTRRWYTFQNMGPSPSPRSGHGMAAHGDKILVFGGEPSSAPRDSIELSDVYILDTSKIRYPEDKMAPKTSGGRRPSITDRSGTPQQDRSASRDGSISSQNVNGRQLTTRGSQDSMASNSDAYARPPPQQQQQQQQQQQGGYLVGYNPNSAGIKIPRSAPSPVPSGPPPQQPAPQPRMNGIRNLQSSAMEGRESPRPPPKQDRVISPEPAGRENMTSPTYGQRTEMTNGPPPNGGQYVSAREETYAPQSGLNHQKQSSLDSNNRRMTETPDAGARVSEDLIRPGFKQQQYADSGVGSSPALSTQQNNNDSISRELESVRSKNAWYATELALARKAGYRRSETADSPISASDDRAFDVFGDEERPLLEAFLRMRSELVKMQESLNIQSASAAGKIAQAEREKEAAVSEVAFHKAQLASRDGDLSTAGMKSETWSARLEEANRRLASTLAAQSGLQAQIKSLSQALESERRAREASDEAANAAHVRAADLDGHKQKSVSELESLRVQLFDMQREARDKASAYADAQSSYKLAEVTNRELTSKLSSIQNSQKSHIDVLRSLREAVDSSHEKAEALSQQLEEERSHRSAIELELSQLRSEHENHSSKLDAANRQLLAAQELSERHAAEARSHREAVLAGLGKEIDRSGDDSDLQNNNEERVTVLQQHLDETKQLAGQHKEAADKAAERARKAEERIAGLEAYQSQASREALSLRNQLNSSLAEASTRSTEHAELTRSLDQHKIEILGWQAQNTTLRSILEQERGIDTSSLPTDLSAYISTSSSNNIAAESKKIQQLEEQLIQSNQTQEELRKMFQNRESQLRQEMVRTSETTEKEVSNLHRYIEKCQDVLEKMKNAVAEEKAKNRTLREQLAAATNISTASSSPIPPSSAAAIEEAERENTTMRSTIESLQHRLEQHQNEISTHLAALGSATSERDAYRDEALRHQRALQDSTARNANDVASLQIRNRSLEERADEAERKVQMLLDTIGNSVENYRRQSRRISAGAAGPSVNGAERGFLSTSRNANKHGRSMSGLAERTEENPFAEDNERGFDEDEEEEDGSHYSSRPTSHTHSRNHSHSQHQHQHQHNRSVSGFSNHPNAASHSRNNSNFTSLRQPDGRYISEDEEQEPTNRNSTAYEGMLHELEKMRDDWASSRERYSHGMSSDAGGDLAGGGRNRLSAEESSADAPDALVSGGVKNAVGSSAATPNGNAGVATNPALSAAVAAATTVETR